MSSILNLSRLRALLTSPVHNRALVMVVSGIFAIAGVLGWLFEAPGALVDVLWLIAAVIAGSDIAVRAFNALRNRSMSIELLVTIAAVGAVIIGEYWEAAAVTLLFAIGGYLEARTLARTRAALGDLLALAPTEVTVLRNGEEATVDPMDVAAGETVVVRPGGRIAVDGTVLSGRASVDESAINGEPMPASKETGDRVFAGTTSHDGYLTIRAEQVGADTTLAHIIHRVEEAQEAKAPTQRFIERFASWYTPAIVVMAAVTYLLTQNAVLALTLLVIACPGALVISTPISIIAGIGRGAREGVLIKGGEHLETAGRIRVVAFDKTGTLTVGRPEIVSTVPLADMPTLSASAAADDKQMLLSWAAVAEAGSEHPLAKAVFRALGEVEDLPRADEFETFAGGGIRAEWNGREIHVGQPDWIAELSHTWSDAVAAATDELRERGETVAVVAVDGQPVGLLGFADTVRPEAASAIQRLRDQGVRHIVMLTGDHHASGARVGEQLGITDIRASLLPEQKLEAIEALRREYGPVAMTGDGINDAPALAAADIGIAMGATGTAVAVESADIALMTDKLSLVPRALELARATLVNIRQNVVIALLTVAGLLAGVMMDSVHMAGGMFVHQVSVLVVVVNGMRLLRNKPRGVKSALQARAEAAEQGA